MRPRQRGTYRIVAYGDPLEVDLSGVSFFDAAALHAFLNVRQRNPYGSSSRARPYCACSSSPTPSTSSTRATSRRDGVHAHALSRTKGLSFRKHANGTADSS